MIHIYTPFVISLFKYASFTAYLFDRYSYLSSYLNDDD